MWRALLVVTALAVFGGACGDDDKPGSTGDATNQPETSEETADMSPDGETPSGPVTCLDDPSALPMPPTASLPCDLVPPSLR